MMSRKKKRRSAFSNTKFDLKKNAFSIIIGFLILILIVLVFYSETLIKNTRVLISNNTNNISSLNKSLSYVPPPSALKHQIESHLSSEGDHAYFGQYKHYVSPNVPEFLYVGLFNKFNHTIKLKYVESESRFGNVFFILCNDPENKIKSEEISKIFYFNAPKEIEIKPKSAISFRIDIVSRQITKKKNFLCKFFVYIDNKKYLEKEFEVITLP